MNTNRNRVDLTKEVTTTTCGVHDDFVAVKPQTTPPGTFSKEGKFAKNAADRREQNLYRAIVAGTILILVWVAIVIFLRFVAPDRPADDHPTSGTEMTTHY
jgi:hypothetical protein